MSPESRYFLGKPRAYEEAVRLGVIEPRIRNLVAAFNVPGIVSTFASCEGHPSVLYPLLGTSRAPFVAFRSAPGLAGRLGGLLMRESVAVHGRLNYYWSVEGWFDADDTIRFALRCTDRHRLTRARLDEDLALLRSWAEDIFQPREILVEKQEQRAAEQQRGQNRPVTEPAMRIGSAAVWTGHPGPDRNETQADTARSFCRHFLPRMLRGRLSSISSRRVRKKCPSGGRRLSRHVMKWRARFARAVDSACCCIGMGEEAAHHYGYAYRRWHIWTDGCRGFVAGWLDDNQLQVPVHARLLRSMRRRPLDQQ
ncbi:hypothetical protein [Paraburkholderia tropica]|uniref:hypothetical protein n=1 Tax=Paraburkholderia tropica TaxID=92647 RepID=UPI002AB7DFC4|nr:hypothetical protein [Paraburkholderia tropica]